MIVYTAKSVSVSVTVSSFTETSSALDYGYLDYGTKFFLDGGFLL